MKGQARQGVTIQGLPLVFGDGTAELADTRHAALRAFGEAMWSEPLRQYVADQAETTVSTVKALDAAPAPVSTNNTLANAMLVARTLLSENLGVEVVFVEQGSYDTHAGQVATQEALLRQLDAAVEAFYFGTMGGTDLCIGPLAGSVADRTLLMTTSEFGRRIGENGAGLSGVAGTDHAAVPMLFIGPPAGGGSTPTSLQCRPKGVLRGARAVRCGPSGRCRRDGGRA